MKRNNKIIDFVLDLYHSDVLSDKDRELVDNELSKNEELLEHYREIVMADKEVQQLFFQGDSFSSDCISTFMLDKYHLNALSDKERKLVDAELSKKGELFERYQIILKTDEEIRKKFSLDNPAAHIREDEDSDEINEEYKLIKTNAGIIIFWLKIVQPRISAAHKEYIEILKKPITFEKIKGNLYFWGNAKKQVYLEFIFDEYQDTVPFSIEMHFKTTKQNKEKFLIPINKLIKDIELGIKGLRSSVRSGIDSFGGIDANYEIRIELFTK